MSQELPIDLKYVSLLWAGPERAAEIAQLHSELFSPPWSEDSVKEQLDHPAATAFVAVVGAGAQKQCVGFVLAQLAADEAEILSIGVTKAWQRKGVGRKLIEGVARAVQRAEAKKLYLEVAADNDAALALYSRAGFLGTGLRRGYYERPGGDPVDAVTFALKL